MAISSIKIARDGPIKGVQADFGKKKKKKE
jgi:hypothetical protein